MTNTTQLTAINHAEAEGELTLAGIPGYSIHTTIYRIGDDRAHWLKVVVNHGARWVGAGNLRVATDDDPGVAHWWGYITIEGFPWCVSGVRGSGILEFRGDVRLPAKAEWATA